MHIFMKKFIVHMIALYGKINSFEIICFFIDLRMGGCDNTLNRCNKRNLDAMNAKTDAIYKIRMQQTRKQMR